MASPRRISHGGNDLLQHNYSFTVLTLINVVAQGPVAQGIGVPTFRCVGFRGRVSQVRILPGPLVLTQLSDCIDAAEAAYLCRKQCYIP